MDDCRIRIEGLTAKMRSKIKEHGEWWRTRDRDEWNPGDEVIIYTLENVHNRKMYPYAVRVMIFRDIKVLAVRAI